MRHLTLALLALLLPAAALGSPKCFSREQSLVGLSTDGRYGVFTDIEVPSQGGSIRLRNLTTQETIWTGPSRLRFELEEPELSELLPRALVRAIDFRTVDDFSDRALGATAADEHRVEVALGDRRQSFPLTFATDSLQVPLAFEGAYAIADRVVVVFRFSDGRDCADAFFGTFALSIAARGFGDGPTLEDWEESLGRRPPAATRVDIRRELFERDEDPLTAAALVHRLRSHPLVQDSPDLRAQLRADRLDYLAHLGLAGRVVCAAEAEEMLEELHAREPIDDVGTWIWTLRDLREACDLHGD